MCVVVVVVVVVFRIQEFEFN